VALLLKNPGWRQERILQFPESILTARGPDIGNVEKSSDLYGKLLKMEVVLQTVSDRELAQESQATLGDIITRVQAALTLLHKRLAA